MVNTYTCTHMYTHMNFMYVPFFGFKYRTQSRNFPNTGASKILDFYYLKRVIRHQSLSGSNGCARVIMISCNQIHGQTVECQVLKYNKLRLLPTNPTHWVVCVIQDINYYVIMNINHALRQKMLVTVWPWQGVLHSMRPESRVFIENWKWVSKGGWVGASYACQWWLYHSPEPGLGGQHLEFSC